MRVAVTGASGAIGRFVVAALLDAGHEVTALDRKPWPDDAPSRRPHKFVIGRADDTRALDAVLEGAQVLVHLAAIPSPALGTPVEVFGDNARATMAALWAAAERGFIGAIIASSLSALGLAYAKDEISPVYAPVDEDHPVRPQDPYALSKVCDEVTAACVSSRFGMPVLAYRFPYTTGHRAIQTRAIAMACNPVEGARELWGYLDVQDAARASLLGVKALAKGDIQGCHVLNIVADDSLLAEPLSALFARYHPSTRQEASLAGARSAYASTLAAELIDFRAERVLHTAG